MPWPTFCHDLDHEQEHLNGSCSDNQMAVGFTDIIVGLHILEMKMGHSREMKQIYIFRKIGEK